MENTNIAKKLLAVMAECAYVAKNGLNSFHKYKYPRQKMCCKRLMKR